MHDLSGPMPEDWRYSQIPEFDNVGPFIGRDDDLIKLDALIESRKVPKDTLPCLSAFSLIKQCAGKRFRKQDIPLKNATAVIGTSGQGKTRLVWEYCCRARQEGKYHAIFWIDGTDQKSVLKSLAQLSNMIFGSQPDTVYAMANKVIEFIEKMSQPWLMVWDDVVWDGCNLPEDIASLQELMPRGGKSNGSMVLTSRRLDLACLNSRTTPQNLIHLTDPMSKVGFHYLYPLTEDHALDLFFSLLSPREEWVRTSSMEAGALEIINYLGSRPLVIIQATELILHLGLIDLSTFLRKYKKHSAITKSNIPLLRSNQDNEECLHDTLDDDIAELEGTYRHTFLLLAFYTMFDSSCLTEELSEAAADSKVGLSYLFPWGRHFTKSTGKWDSEGFQRVFGYLHQKSLVRLIKTNSLGIGKGSYGFSIDRRVRESIQKRLRSHENDSMRQWLANLAKDAIHHIYYQSSSDPARHMTPRGKEWLFQHMCSIWENAQSTIKGSDYSKWSFKILSNLARDLRDHRAYDLADEVCQSMHKKLEGLGNHSFEHASPAHESLVRMFHMFEMYRQESTLNASAEEEECILRTISSIAVAALMARAEMYHRDESYEEAAWTLQLAMSISSSCPDLDNDENDRAVQSLNKIWPEALNHAKENLHEELSLMDDAASEQVNGNMRLFWIRRMSHICAKLGLSATAQWYVVLQEEIKANIRPGTFWTEDNKALVRGKVKELVYI
ncbi:hypothetical protein N7461_000412 [Penicillium sp. DV-2018c]|nr:hypothetical protein N7461_000412 [Penicillium sp. DV-2018c]